MKNERDSSVSLSRGLELRGTGGTLSPTLLFCHQIAGSSTFARSSSPDYPVGQHEGPTLTDCGVRRSSLKHSAGRSITQVNLRAASE
jgi:hypothetical protein